ncbi:hypothetical protein [uncultured Erythrobacter sp.]|uniref:hypothetical protein n=1 Tax=uncultured Erythrobacter sp. TaxID=263913 RepID=UPI002620503C|nr:hypothetical protein [uncultured Erythrobacter sp.]
MLDELPETPIELSEPAQRAAEIVEPHLPTETREDGLVVIDLSGLVPTPTECLDREPDPFNPEIVVCRRLTPSPRLGANYGPSAGELIEGSAVPRARVRISEDAEAEANVTSEGVGGWNANGAEVRARIKF